MTSSSAVQPQQQLPCDARCCRTRRLKRRLTILDRLPALQHIAQYIVASMRLVNFRHKYTEFVVYKVAV